MWSSMTKRDGTQDSEGSKMAEEDGHKSFVKILI